jgi:hypothetical protein
MANISNAVRGVDLSPETLDQIMAKIAEIRELMPGATGLSSRERLQYPALGSKGQHFVQRALENMRVHSSLVPAFIDVTEAENTFALYSNLQGVVKEIDQLNQLISDSMHVAGSQVRNQTFVFYEAVKTGAKAEVPGAKAVFENLKTRFSRPSGSSAAAKAAKSGGTAPE